MRKFLALLLFAAACQKNPKPSSVHFEGTALTIPYHIIVGQELTLQEKTATASTLNAVFQKVDSTLNNWNPDSEISRLNAAPAHTPIALSEPLYETLLLCQKIHSLSGGRFDPTVEPLQKLWDNSLQNKKAPDAAQILSACGALGWKHIALQNGELVKDHPGTRIDLCGIAKGVCIDWIASALKQMGIRNFCIDWGGEVRAEGRHPQLGPWKIPVDPSLRSQGGPLAPITLKNSSVSLSADQSRQGWQLSEEGQIHRYFPIIDPFSAQPLEKTEYSIAAAIVTAPSSALADALATAAMLFPGRKEAEKWAEEVVELYPDVSFCILSYRKDHD